MSKFETLERIKELGIVAVIRGKDANEALEYSRACVEGGVNVLEITFTVPNAVDVLKELNYNLKDNALLGAGTVLDPITARLAIMNGAKFIVSPSFDEEVAKLCNLYQVPYMPGCMTPTEITNALKFGVDVIKVFPGSAFGPRYFKDIHGPLPNVNLMPTGGVNVENVSEWIKNGAFAVGVGSSLVKGSREEIIEKAEKFIKNIKEARA
ncbi:bifunctional 2-keto-4-hydroxyglutarate aldolase/2-keto-3-deoxy-6-phosphogluconate aldolase [Anaerosphaera multitolerans]|uniref:Bifunctional 4-hydroxy-2-oxoglutarate aldolase/2-dehydro-3-deoxy-phosphogluconate aldolase n=1 Tax=Anaerosphaera multitolerans TaxID=2487351 RepID=A0A437S7P4_9FIRM|nr:bifunctional 2-keto-4-hydroxyglutarate aldolase/2-keto-3-deoxy-6-phosphogluconate aldolase [Anaerosphaera multitolerans]RVU55095.1 bifunctional 4-hydroxy-2-oxoglutarate aldolase/2-dehydro-3-deoxy-phosphogluconate aldolase [Anaerosphaera multitolerans]